MPFRIGSGGSERSSKGAALAGLGSDLSGLASSLRPKKKTKPTKGAVRDKLRKDTTARDAFFMQSRFRGKGLK
jgi:hypothetical protein